MDLQRPAHLRAELPTLEIETVSASDAGVYAVEVSSGSEQVTSATAHLVLIETIPLAEAVDQPDMNFESPQVSPLGQVNLPSVMIR